MTTNRMGFEEPYKPTMAERLSLAWQLFKLVTIVVVLLAMLVLLSHCASRVERAADACAAYGLAGDPHCVAMVAEQRRPTLLVLPVLPMVSPAPRCFTFPNGTGATVPGFQTVCQ